MAAPASGQMNLKPGQAGFIVCPPSQLPVRFRSGQNITLEKTPMWSVWEMQGYKDPSWIFDKILWNAPTGCRPEVFPETAQDRAVRQIRQEVDQKQETFVQTGQFENRLTQEQASILEYAKAKRENRNPDLDKRIPDSIKAKYYEYLRKELASIQKELPLIASLALKTSNYSTNRISEIDAVWKRIDQKVALAQRHAQKKQKKEDNRNSIMNYANQIGGIALNFIPYVGQVVSLVATTTVQFVNAKYNSDLMNKVQRRFNQTMNSIQMEENTTAVNALEGRMLKDEAISEQIESQADFYQQVNAVPSIMLLTLNKLKYGIWDDEELFQALKSKKAKPVGGLLGIPLWAIGAGAAALGLVLFVE